MRHEDIERMVVAALGSRLEGHTWRALLFIPRIKTHIARRVSVSANHLHGSEALDLSSALTLFPVAWHQHHLVVAYETSTSGDFNVDVSLWHG